ncbi:MAG: diaminopimelate epimerase [Cyclobacteriaceae bacterium]
MKLHFHKYQGTGNDFILIDDRNMQFPIDKLEIISQLCDRKFGIGADGFMLIRPHETVDFTMIFFNPDGSKSLCGNGSRCAMAFATHLGIVGKQMAFETTDGIHDGYYKDGLYHFQLFDVNEIIRSDETYFINTGSPHHVQIVQNVQSCDVVVEGKKIRYSSKYEPAGTNVNFIQKKVDSIDVRTYERGVENETLSCGTGVTACAIVAALENYQSPIKVETQGGNLQVSFTKVDDTHFKDIYLAGPAEKVFEGDIEVELSN